MNYKNLTKYIIFSLSLSFVSTFLKAENLEEVYELALKNDPLLKAAEKVPHQAKAKLRRHHNPGPYDTQS